MDSLEKQLICPICFEIFTKPVVILPCQHNLCRKCANDIFQASNLYLPRGGSTVSSGGRFRCPSCRQEVVLDRHGVYGLQRNLLVENIIDMYKQENISTSSKAEMQPKNTVLMCEVHEDEKINIYCVSCSIPTCSMCKVFGAHQSCEVAPLTTVYESLKTELSEAITMLVGNNDRLQAIITILEESCRTVEENGRRQKSVVCESFDHLYTILEERKGELTPKISSEQQEKLDYIKGLQDRYTEHLDKSAKLIETGIQTIKQPEMAVFLQNTKSLLQKMVERSNTSHLEKLQNGYEKMDHFTVSFERERRAILTIDFSKNDMPDGDDDENKSYENEMIGRSSIQKISTPTLNFTSIVASAPVQTRNPSPAQRPTTNQTHTTHPPIPISGPSPSTTTSNQSHTTYIPISISDPFSSTNTSNQSHITQTLTSILGLFPSTTTGNQTHTTHTTTAVSGSYKSTITSNQAVNTHTNAFTPGPSQTTTIHPAHNTHANIFTQSPSQTTNNILQSTTSNQGYRPPDAEETFNSSTRSASQSSEEGTPRHVFSFAWLNTAK